MSEKPTVERLLRRWVQLRNQGLKPEIEDLCQDCPELAGLLRERIEQHRRCARAEPPGPGPAEPSAAPDQTTAAAPAIRISGYTILREIGHGGQGVIFKALQHSTGRHVAVKILTETRQLSDVERTRFDREAQVLAALEHPHIVSILDRGHTAAGSAYFAMEYIEGRSLDRWLQDYRRDHPPPDIPSNPGELLRLFMKIADAVNVAHLRGIIHRDLKPSNILVDGAGNPHVLDFGLARLGLPAEVYSEQRRAVTVTGQFIGTLPWVSPEQAEGLTSKVDTRTDVYSLGVILYEMLTGEFPYEVVGNMRDVLDNILRAQPKPPSTVIEARLAQQARKTRRWRRAPRNPITPDLEAIVLKALNKKLEDRYQNAGELARDIGSYLSGRPTLAAELRPRLSRRRIAWAASAGAVLVLLIPATVVWMPGFLHPPAAPQPQPIGAIRSSEAPPATSFLTDPNLRAAVREALGLKDREVTPADMLPLTKLDASNKGLRDLTGLERATNLTSLNLNRNRISDLAPLAGLVQLQELRLAGNQISDVSPISGLRKLRQLILGDYGEGGGNRVTDIRPLGQLTQLVELCLHDNRVNDIGPLSGMTQLQTLHLAVNPIEDLSPLAGLKQLTGLWCFHTRVADLTALRDLTNLVTLCLSYNQISDLAPLSNLQKLLDLDIDDNPIHGNIAPLAGLKSLRRLHVKYCEVSDLSALASLTGLEDVSFPHNRIADLSPMLEHTRLRRLTLTGNPLSRPAIDTQIPRIRANNPGIELSFDAPEPRGAWRIPDPNLTAAIKEALGLKDRSPTPEDMRKLTKLDASARGIRDLTGLEQGTNLTSLMLNNNQITDLSALANVKKLTYLWVMKNRVGDVSPLAGLSSLRVLLLSNNQIRDLSPLSGLNNLKELSVDVNPIGGRIAPVAGLVKLTLLHITGNDVRDLSALGELTSLEDLWLSGNRITDLAPLLSHARLRVLRLDGNPLSPTAVGSQIARIRANNPTIDLSLDVRASPP